jgi:hypothetical protein
MKNLALSLSFIALTTSLSGCINTSGLKAQASSDMHCDEDELSTHKVRGGYSGDDFGAQFEVEGCGEKVLYEKKGPAVWAAVSEAESVE